MEREFPKDIAIRKKFMIPEAFMHPAKANWYMMEWIFDYLMEKNWLKKGDLVLDPMCGIGTTNIVTSLKGIHSIGIEYEQKFVDICLKNKKKLTQVNQEQLFQKELGKIAFLKGDARDLSILNKIDAIITSPPYEQTMGDKHYSPRANRLMQLKKHITAYSGIRKNLKFEGKRRINYSRGDGQIGNLRKEAYLSAMLRVYQECYNVLKPDGVMVLITKNFVRNKEIVPLDRHTISLCERVGFKLIERHARKINYFSFWQILRIKKNEKIVDKEDILIFQKS